MPQAAAARHTTSVYECRRRGRKGAWPDAGLPSSGNPYRGACVRVADGFAACRTGWTLAGCAATARQSGAGTANNVLAGAGRNLKPVVARTIAAMRRAGVLHVDETPLKLDGKLVRVWIFRDLWRAAPCSRMRLHEARAEDLGLGQPRHAQRRKRLLELAAAENQRARKITRTPSLAMEIAPRLMARPAGADYKLPLR